MHTIYYLCPVCDKEHYSQKSMQIHVRKHHWSLTGAAGYRCVRCPHDTFYTLLEVVNHARTHRSQMWNCQYCPVVVPHEDVEWQKKHDVLEHMALRVVPGSGYLCGTCNTECLTRPALGYHLLSEHNDSSLEMSERKRDTKYTCNYCAKTFKTLHARFRHILKEHDPSFKDKKENEPAEGRGSGEEDPENDEGEAGDGADPSVRFFCPVCDAFYQQEVNFREHLETRHWVKINDHYKCKQCEFYHESFPKMVKHARGHNETVKKAVSPSPAAGAAVGLVRTLVPGMCQYCKEVFPSVRRLKEHMAVVHDLKSREKKSFIVSTLYCHPFSFTP